MKTALMPEVPYDNMNDFRVWLINRYNSLSLQHAMLFRSKNPQMHNIHARQLELIEVGKVVGIELPLGKYLEDIEEE